MHRRKNFSLKCSDKIIENTQPNNCSVCNKQFNDWSGVIKAKHFHYFDTRLNVEKEVGVLEAIRMLFEGLFYMNKTAVPPRKNFTVCYDCLCYISDMYKKYWELIERTDTNAYFRKLFPKCAAWKHLDEEINQLKSYVTSNTSASPTNKVKSVSTGPTLVLATDLFVSHEKVNNSEGAAEAAKTKSEVKIETADPPFEVDYDDHFVGTPYENLPLNDAPSPSDYDNNYHDKTKPSPIKLSNGTEVVLSKSVKVVLKRYVPGDNSTVDYKRSRLMKPKKIKLSNGDVVQLPAKEFVKRCNICNEVIKGFRSYNDHRREHKTAKKIAGLPIFPCKKCGKEFTKRYRLVNHDRAVHSIERPFSCSRCDKRYAFADHLKTHIRIYHDSSLEFRRNYERRRRLAMIEKGLERRKVKSLGEGKIENAADIVDIEACEKVEAAENGKQEPEFQVGNTQEQELFQTLEAEQILSDLPEPESLLSQNSESGTQTEIAAASQSVQLADSQEKLCPVCKIVFESPEAKENHFLQLHKNERAFICRFCSKGFHTEKACKHHEEVHLGVKAPTRLPCTLCSKTFESSWRLSVHMDRIHNNDQEFFCHQCGKSCTTADAFRRHSKIHDTDRSHLCGVCGKGFKTSPVLKVHMAIHASEVSSYLCGDCGLELKTKRIFMRHICTHHGVGAVMTCDLCERGFAALHDYDKHMEKGVHVKRRIPKSIVASPRRKRRTPEEKRLCEQLKIQEQEEKLEKKCITMKLEVGEDVLDPLLLSSKQRKRRIDAGRKRKSKIERLKRSPAPPEPEEESIIVKKEVGQVKVKRQRKMTMENNRGEEEEQIEYVVVPSDSVDYPDELEQGQSVECLETEIIQVWDVTTHEGNIEKFEDDENSELMETVKILITIPSKT